MRQYSYAVGASVRSERDATEELDTPELAPTTRTHANAAVVTGTLGLWLSYMGRKVCEN